MALQGPTASYWTNPANETGRNAPIPINDDKQENVPRPELARRMEAVGIKGGVTPENLKKYCQYLAEKGDHVVTLGSGPNASRFAPASWGNSAATAAKKGAALSSGATSLVTPSVSTPGTQEETRAIGTGQSDLPPAADAGMAAPGATPSPAAEQGAAPGSVDASKATASIVSALQSRGTQAPLTKAQIDTIVTWLISWRKTHPQEGPLTKADMDAIAAWGKAHPQEPPLTKAEIDAILKGVNKGRPTQEKPKVTLNLEGNYQRNADGTYNIWKPIEKPKSPVVAAKVETTSQGKKPSRARMLAENFVTFWTGGDSWNVETGERVHRVPFGTVFKG